MDQKEILHELLKGFCPYMSVGVPTVLWKLAKKLTKEVYGRKGVALLTEYHTENLEQYDANTESLLHCIEGWDGGGNTQILPPQLIEKLEAL